MKLTPRLSIVMPDGWTLERIATDTYRSIDRQWLAVRSIIRTAQDSPNADPQANPWVLKHVSMRGRERFRELGNVRAWLKIHGPDVAEGHTPPGFTRDKHDAP